MRFVRCALFAIQLALGAVFLLVAPGGMLSGAALGWIGSLLGLAAWRTWFVEATALPTFGFGLSWRPFPLGRQHQGPRERNQTMSPGRRYLFWSAVLQRSLATPVPTSAFLVLLGVQAAGQAVGEVFGATRQAIALLPALCRLDPGATMALLTWFRATARCLNAVVPLGAGLMLVVFRWH